MSAVSGKCWVKVSVVGTVTAVVVMLCLVVVSSRHFNSYLAVAIADVKYTSRDTITRSQDINSSDICTVEVFRHYYRMRDCFPGEGHWDSRKNVSATSYRFVPDLCKFHFDGFRRLPGVDARRCLRRHNVTRIMTLGDSNAARYYAALLTALTDSDDGRWRCVTVTAEAIDHTLMMPDVRYFARHDRRLLALLRATARHCSSCLSRVDRCSRRTADQGAAGTGSGTEEETLWLEHVAMVSLLDSSVKIDVPHNHFVVNLRYRADTFQVTQLATPSRLTGLFSEY